MELTSDLKNKGLSLCDIELSDFETYYNVSKMCYEKYVVEFFGGWIEENQIKMNKDAFIHEMKETCFKKLLLNGSTVGFLAFDVLEDRIDGVMIQMLAEVQNKGIGSFYLRHIVSLSNQQNKPIFLRVFMSNPAQNLYMRFGFEVYDKTISHYLMRYDPK